MNLLKPPGASLDNPKATGLLRRKEIPGSPMWLINPWQKTYKAKQDANQVLPNLVFHSSLGTSDLKKLGQTEQFPLSADPSTGGSICLCLVLQAEIIRRRCAAFQVGLLVYNGIGGCGSEVSGASKREPMLIS